MAGIGIVAPTVTQKEMDRWIAVTKELADLKVEEMLLRKKIFACYITDPVEGTNTVPLNEGWVVKGIYKIDRKVEEASLSIYSTVFKENKIPVKELIKYKPELVVPEYRKLTAEQVKIFDQVLIIKPVAPALEIVQPKR